MDPRRSTTLLLLLLALAHLAEESSAWEASWDSGVEFEMESTNTTKGAAGDDGGGADDDRWTEFQRPCNATVGECAEGDQGNATSPDGEMTRRAMRGRGKRYISYGALKKNQVPCNRRGSSYYNCQPRGRANPYKRACTVITRCKRMLK